MSDQPRSVSLSAGSSDMHGSNTLGLVSTGTFLLAGWPSGGQTTVWIPFSSVLINRYTQIVSATLKVVVTQDSGDQLFVKIGFEAADSPSAPTTLADLQGRTLTAAYLAANIGAVTEGVQYSYDVTSALQEIVYRAGWAYGNNVAVLVKHNGTPAGEQHRWASVENTLYTEPILDVTFLSFIPQGSGVI